MQAPKQSQLSQETLMAVLSYDPLTGLFHWIGKHIKAHRVVIGAVAGREIKNGYIQIGIHGKYYLAHRLAFLYMTGTLPVFLVDHDNGNTQDNRWANLKEATTSQNCQNAAMSKNNTSGVKGVTWNIGANKWVASIGHQGKTKHLGCFDNIAAAASARKEAEHLLGFHSNHGRPANK